MNNAAAVTLSTLLSRGRSWETMERSTSILAVDLVHESTMIRRGLAAMLETLPEIGIAKQIDNTGAYERLPGPCRARVAFVSPRTAAELSQGDPRLGTRRVDPSVGLIVVAPTFGDLDAREAFQVGVKGLLLVTAGPGELLEAARRVAMGGRYVMQSIAAAVALEVCKQPLTARERQVLELVAEGACNLSIASELGIALSTVKAHMRTVMSKLDVRTRTQAALAARQRGMGGSRQH